MNQIYRNNDQAFFGETWVMVCKGIAEAVRVGIFGGTLTVYVEVKLGVAMHSPRYIRSVVVEGNFPVKGNAVTRFKLQFRPKGTVKDWSEELRKVFLKKVSPNDRPRLMLEKWTDKTPEVARDFGQVYRGQFSEVTATRVLGDITEILTGSFIVDLEAEVESGDREEGLLAMAKRNERTSIIPPVSARAKTPVTHRPTAPEPKRREIGAPVVRKVRKMPD